MTAATAASYVPHSIRDLPSDEADPADAAERLVDDCAAGRITRWSALFAGLDDVLCTRPENIEFRCAVAMLRFSNSLLTDPLALCPDTPACEAIGFLRREFLICPGRATGDPKAEYDGDCPICFCCQNEILVGQARRGDMPVVVSSWAPEDYNFRYMIRGACKSRHAPFARSAFAAFARRVWPRPDECRTDALFHGFMAQPLQFRKYPNLHLSLLCASAEAGLIDVVDRVLLAARAVPARHEVNTAMFCAGLGRHPGLAWALAGRYAGDLEAGFLGACAGGDSEAMAAFAAVSSAMIRETKWTADLGFAFAAAWANDLRLAEEVMHLGWPMSVDCITDTVAELLPLGRHRMILDVVRLGIGHLNFTQGDLDTLLRLTEPLPESRDSAWLREARVFLLLTGANPGPCDRLLPADAQRRLIARGVWPPGGTCLSLRTFCIETRRIALETVAAASGLAPDVVRHCILTYLW